MRISWTLDRISLCGDLGRPKSKLIGPYSRVFRPPSKALCRSIGLPVSAKRAIKSAAKKTLEHQPPQSEPQVPGRRWILASPTTSGRRCPRSTRWRIC